MRFLLSFFRLSARKEKTMNYINAKEIGSRIRALRMKRGITQQRLADTIGVTLSTVGRIESGIKMGSIDLIVDIAIFFGVSLDYLILGKG